MQALQELNNEKKKVSVSEVITNIIINNLAYKNGKMSMPPWFYTPSKSYNPYTKIHYFGLNTFLLNDKPNNNKSDVYLRESDIKDIGGKIKKFAKANYIIQPTSSLLYSQLKYNNHENENNLKVKYLKVYNIDDLDTIEKIEDLSFLNLYDQYIFNKKLSNNIIRSLVKNTGLKIIIANAKPFYSSKRDTLVIPPINSYKDEASFYGELFRMLSFVVAHKKRLDMPEIKFENNIYTTNKLNEKRISYSSIVADMNMALLSSKVNNKYNVTRSKKYINTLIKTLKEDNRIILKASYQADVIKNYLLRLGLNYNTSK